MDSDEWTDGSHKLNKDYKPKPQSNKKSFVIGLNPINTSKQLQNNVQTPEVYQVGEKFSAISINGTKSQPTLGGGLAARRAAGGLAARRPQLSLAGGQNRMDFIAQQS